METKTRGNVIQGVLSGIGFAIIFLLLGLVLDYGITQILSQYFIADCSEDCYFQYFNAIFIGVAILSIGGGLLAGMRVYHRSSK